MFIKFVGHNAKQQYVYHFTIQKSLHFDKINKK